MNPIRYDGTVAVFNVEDVDLWGEPCYFGYEDYIVVSSLDYERPLTADYKFELDRERARPVVPNVFNRSIGTIG